MTNDIPYKHKETGQIRMLPEGVGEKIGYERVENFTPPELQPAAESENGSQELTGNPVKDAVDVLEARLKDSDGLSDEEFEQFDRLIQVIFNDFGPVDANRPVGKANSADPFSLIQVVNHLESKVDADSRISETAKKQFKKHLSDLLDGLPVITEEESKQSDSVDPTATATTNPLEPDLPGKSDGDSQPQTSSDDATDQTPSNGQDSKPE